MNRYDMPINRFDLQKLRDLPIEAVARRLGLEVVRHKALCPFHPDSHPSLSFSVAHNSFRCFVCDAHGGVIDLCMKMLGKPFIECCRWLADENNIILQRYQPAVKQLRRYPPDTDFLAELVRVPFLNEAARCFLFDQRRYNPEVVKWLGISSISNPTPCWRYGRPFYDAPSLLLPYRDVNGRVLNVQSRYLGPAGGGGKSIPRFRFPSNSSIHIFNLPILRHLGPEEPLFISEGITDCIALLSAGHKAIAIPSATLLKADDLAVLRRGDDAAVKPGGGLDRKQGGGLDRNSATGPDRNSNAGLDWNSNAGPDRNSNAGLDRNLGGGLDWNSNAGLDRNLGWKGALHIFPDNDEAGNRLYHRLLDVATQLGRCLVKHELPTDCKDFSDYYLKQLKSSNKSCF